MIKKVNIWDLDGTVINSAHRVQPCMREGGDLDLIKYAREACTHELIMGDTLLPLVETMRRSMSDPNTVNIIVTARLMHNSDYYFLRSNGLRCRGRNAVQVYSRDTLTRHVGLERVKALYHSGDAVYKSAYFEIIRAKYPDADVTVYDDHKGVLKAATSFGFKVLDAELVNDILMVGSTLIGNAIIDEHMADDLDVEYLQAKLEFAWDCLTAEEQQEYSGRPSVHVLAA